MNKDVCKQCIYRGSHALWNESDERYWNTQVIYCPPPAHVFVSNAEDLTMASPPPWCRYKLEHAVLSQ